MDQSNIEFPKITLGGVEYTVKFTRGGMIYRMIKSGASFADLVPGSPKFFSAVIDTLHAALFGQFAGSPEELAEIIVSENKVKDCAVALNVAMGKVFPPTQAAAPVDEQKPLENAPLPN
jgi:hypothetical protein